MKWSLPPTGWLKINVDGSVKEKTEIGGIGYLIRDHTGGCSFAASVFACVAEPIEAKLLAIRSVVSSGKRMFIHSRFYLLE